MKPVLVVCGFNREAALAAGPGIETVVGGGQRAGLERSLAALDPTRYAAVISFGLAGALSPVLRVGDIVAPDGCVCRDGAVPLTLEWSSDEAAVLRIKTELTLVGVDAPAVTQREKSDLAEAFGADLVDMESHVAGAFAARSALPFGILRVVSDDSARDMPPLVAVAMRPDGGLDLRAIMRSLLRDPGQVPGLIRTAWDAEIAFRQLSRVGRALRRGGGLLGRDRGLLGLDL